MQKEPAPTTPASLSTCRSCYRNANPPRHIILQPRFTSVLSLSITTRGCCYCVSLSQRWASLGTALLQSDADEQQSLPRCTQNCCYALATLLRLQVGMLHQQQLRAHTNRHTKSSALGLRGSTTGSFECVLPLLQSLRSERKRSVEEN